MLKVLVSIGVAATMVVTLLISKAAFGVLAVLFVSVVLLGVWIKGGGQKAEASIPASIEGFPFRTYKAVVSDSPLELLHFISQPEEINVSSSLIMGHKELICVTAQPTKYAAERLADVIEKTGRNLTFIYLDHPHLDHSQGATVLLKRFPNAKCVAEPRVAALQHRRIEADDKFARDRYGDNAAVPSTPFEALDTDTLTLEGREIQLWHNRYGDVGIGEEDEPHTVMYIPDLKALLPTDICYWGGHMMMGGSTKTSRRKCKEQIRKWMEMDLEVVIPGHILRSWSDSMTPRGVLEYSLEYIEEYERALERCSTADEVVSYMKKKYPDQGHESALFIGSCINFGETHRALFNKRLEFVMSLLPKRLVRWIDRRALEARRRAANPGL